MIGHLKTRDKTITTMTGPNGPLYTVKTANGEVLAEQLPEDELYSKFPELKEVVERALAGNDARLVPSDRSSSVGIPIRRTLK